MPGACTGMPIISPSVSGSSSIARRRSHVPKCGSSDTATRRLATSASGVEATRLARRPRVCSYASTALQRRASPSSTEPTSHWPLSSSASLSDAYARALGTKMYGASSSPRRRASFGSTYTTRPLGVRVATTTWKQQRHAGARARFDDGADIS